MEINHWTRTLHNLYDAAVTLYTSGHRDVSTYFNENEIAFLDSIGLKPIHVYDYAEDVVGRGEPDWDTYLLIASARRDYFTHEMGKKWSAIQIQEKDLPGKDEIYEGIEWLPRIIPKAVAFLEGTLPPEIMYCCGGDRKFFKANDLHPADFLRLVWATKADSAKLAAFIHSNR